MEFKYKLQEGQQANYNILTDDGQEFVVGIDPNTTEEQIENALTEMVNFTLNLVEAKDPVPSYKQLRAEAYPSVQEQLDILFHEGYDGWKTVIQTVKDTYPKLETSNDATE